MRPLELGQIVAKRQMPRPQQHVPRNARFADPLIPTRERIDNPACAEQLPLHERPRPGQNDRIMLVPRIHIPQRRQHVLKKLVARPAGLLERRLADDVGFSCNHFLRRKFGNRNGTPGQRHKTDRKPRGSGDESTNHDNDIRVMAY